MEIRKFTFTSEMFKGEVYFEYSDLYLTKYDASEAELSTTQLVHLATHLPRTINELMDFNDTLKAGKIDEIQGKVEITFDMFWGKYPNKLGSKKRALAKWNRMGKIEQIKAYQFIHKYTKSIPQGINMQYGESYLNAERWNN